MQIDCCFALSTSVKVLPSLSNFTHFLCKSYFSVSISALQIFVFFMTDGNADVLQSVVVDGSHKPLYNIDNRAIVN